MDKRTKRILMGSLACSLIVLILFLIVLRFSQLHCELVHVEPHNLRSAQLSAFSKDKPLRSEDKTILIKFAAYLEYDKPTDSDTDNDRDNSSSHSTSGSQPQQPSLAPQQQQQPQRPITISNGPIPSTVIMPSVGNWSASSSAAAAANKRQEKKRFLPLELDSIETRHMNESNKYKYILSFNCTKMYMVLVRSAERVHVESIRLELKVKNKRKSECEVQLPAGGTFAVASQRATTSSLARAPFGTNSANNNNATQSDEQPRGQSKELVHYFCNKPLRYACLHNADESNSWLNRSDWSAATSGVHVADLHISAIEFETSLSLGSSSSSGDNQKLKHVSKSEFTSKRKECDVQAN